jgi:hypothetical protein
VVLDWFHQLAGDRDLTNKLTGQSVLAVGATASYGVIDLAPLDIGAHQVSDIGRGQPLHVIVRSLVDLASTGAATLQIQLVLADDPDLAVNVTPIYTSRLYGFAEVKRATDLGFQWPRLPSTTTARRYAGLRFVIAGAALTAASFWAATSLDRDSLGPIFNTRWGVK